MKRARLLSLVLGASLAVFATGAAAGERCMLDGKFYPENAVVCSHGLQVHCVNGTWQGNEGARCNEQSGDYIGSFRPYQEKSDEPIPEFYLKKYPWLQQK